MTFPEEVTQEEPQEVTQINPYVALPVQEYLRETIPDPHRLAQILLSLTLAPSTYYLRINLTKIRQETIIQDLGFYFPTATITKGPLSNSLGISIQGPNELQRNPIHIYCDKFAAEAVSLGADLYIPGVCEIGGKFQAGEEVSVLLLPKKVPEGIKYEDHHFQVATGTTQIRSKDFPGMRNGICVKTTRSTYMVPKYRQSSFYSLGLISDHHLQANFATKIFMDQIVQYYFSRQCDPVIYDICSAPGHKTCALSEWGYYLTKQKASPHWFPILSIDRSKNRLEHLQSDIERLGLEEIDVLACKLENIASQHPHLLNNGEYVFFDPPCSALGTRPKLFIQKSRKELVNYAKNQLRLLKMVDTLVKPGGYLMYNTCTIPIQENEGIVAYAITQLGYQLVPLKEEYYTFGQSGLPLEGIPSGQENYMRRFLPNGSDGSDGSDRSDTSDGLDGFDNSGDQGYFIALLKKVPVSQL